MKKISWTHRWRRPRLVYVVVALLASLAGLGSGLSLIVAIGAQNTFVLRQGLRREYVTTVVAVCTASDVVLICAGVAGLGSLVRAEPALLAVARLTGAAFLTGYALLAARRALRGARVAARCEAADGAPQPAAPDRGLTAAPTGRGLPALATVGTCLALTWLNPHVYLDTVVLLGSVAATHGHQRWWFAVGAVTASAVWFAALGYGARLLAPCCSRPATRRYLDAAVAVVMVAVASVLLLGLRGG